MDVPIESVDDLADQTTIEYGTIHGGSSMTFFQVNLILWGAGSAQGTPQSDWGVPLSLLCPCHSGEIPAQRGDGGGHRREFDKEIKFSLVSTWLQLLFESLSGGISKETFAQPRQAHRSQSAGACVRSVAPK